jgi:hypothetical protein
VAVGPGDEHDSVRFIEALEWIRVKRGVGRPRRRPKEPYAGSARIRRYLRRRGVRANIPPNTRSRCKPKREGRTGSTREPTGA